RRSNSDAACRPCCESCGAKTWWRAIVHKSRPEKIPLVGTTAVFRAIPNPYPRKINRLRVQETSKLPNAASNRLTSVRWQLPQTVFKSHVTGALDGLDRS